MDNSECKLRTCRMDSMHKCEGFGYEVFIERKEMSL